MKLRWYSNVMATCDYCGSTIIFGGKRDANGRFCNQECQARGGLLAVSRRLPQSAVQEEVWREHQGLCPNCGGTGPVDVHVSHRVWSALVLTSWRSTPRISCRSCGMRNQMKDTAFSLVLGWWGIPSGLLVTPIQVGRNLCGIVRPPDPSKPSAQFEKIMRMNIAAEAVRQQRSQTAAAGATTS